MREQSDSVWSQSSRPDPGLSPKQIILIYLALDTSPFLFNNVFSRFSLSFSFFLLFLFLFFDKWDFFNTLNLFFPLNPTQKREREKKESWAVLQCMQKSTRFVLYQWDRTSVRIWSPWSGSTIKNKNKKTDFFLNTELNLHSAYTIQCW